MHRHGSQLLILILIVLLAASGVHAQDLVPTPEAENQSVEPDGYIEVVHVWDGSVPLPDVWEFGCIWTFWKREDGGGTARGSAFVGGYVYQRPIS